MVRTIEWRNGTVVMIDQRLLPTQEVYRVCRDYKDVAKAIDALAQCKKSKDKTVGVSYTQKFNTHISTLKKTRARIENPGKEPISKKDMKNAEACVMALKDDLSAWNRIKPIYVKD